MIEDAPPSPADAAFARALADLRHSLGRPGEHDPALVGALGRLAAAWGARRAEEQSRDGLTGVRGRQALLSAADAVAAMARRAGTPLAVLLAGVDHLREINDRHGDAAGDRALTAVAAAVVGAVRGADVVGRYGGDVFAVVGAIAGDAPAPHLERVSEKIRAAVAAVQSLTHPVSVSVGAAAAVITDDPARTLHDLLVRADENLYLAKRGGRNRVVATLLPPSHA